MQFMIIKRLLLYEDEQPLTILIFSDQKILLNFMCFCCFFLQKYLYWQVRGTLPVVSTEGSDVEVKFEKNLRRKCSCDVCHHATMQGYL